MTTSLRVNGILNSLVDSGIDISFGGPSHVSQTDF
jgi:hypothetical protein